ncbi:MAG: crossover junction endodeoxyribonuclease RuvC [Planctomycetota bacterium]
MKVLGVDPGTLVVGLACVETARHEIRTSDAGRISNLVSFSRASSRVRLLDAAALSLGGRKSPIAARLEELAAAIRERIDRWRPDVLAVEEAFYGKSVQAALRIGEARGVVLLCAASAGIPIAQYAPAHVKLRVAGSGAATKQVLAAMVAAQLGRSVDGLPSDATDALAVALCHIQSAATGIPELH